MLVILENVVGFLRVWKRAHKLLKQCGPYLIHKIVLCPSNLGSPCSRRRVYVIMLRKNMLASHITCDKAAVKYMDGMIRGLHHLPAIPFDHLLYPPGHPVFKEPHNVKG